MIRDAFEERRKGQIFSAFLIAVFTLLLSLTSINLYLAYSSEPPTSQIYMDFFVSDIGALVWLGFIWLLRFRFPKLARHFFLMTLVIGAVFFFSVEDLNRLMIVLVMPIIMASFITRAAYSFAYFFLSFSFYTIKLGSVGLNINHVEFAYLNLIALMVVAFVAWLIARSLDNALAESKALNQELDQRVQDRTRELAAKTDELALALQREQATAGRNKTILESIADGILVIDANHQILIANPAANRLAGKDLQASSIDEILALTGLETGEPLQVWVQEDHSEESNTFRFQWENRYISANIAPITLNMDGGKPIDAGQVMVLRDITKEAELEKAKDIFLGTISHELRTPLTAIRGYIDVLLALEQENISPEGYRYLQNVNTSTKQLLALANDLIDLSRLQSSEVELYCLWTDLEPIVTQAISIVEREYTTRDLSLETTIHHPLPTLYLDKRRILQILLNLLSNGYKYTMQGGVTVDVRATESEVITTIHDTGFGIKENDQANLFQRFYRAVEPETREVGGTGLGLSISKGLAELHGGQLTFESEYGVGTTFILTLPIKNPQPTIPEPLALTE